MPADIEFASLDSISSGHALVELALLDRDKGKQRAGEQPATAGHVEIVPLVRLGPIVGLDGVNLFSLSIVFRPPNARIP